VRVSEREKGFYSVLVFEVKEFAVVCVRAREKERERERVSYRMLEFEVKRSADVCVCESEREREGILQRARL